MDVLVIPIGKVNRAALDGVAGAVREMFQCRTESAEAIPVPAKTLNVPRRQYNSTRILQALEKQKPEKYEVLLGVIDEDLYVPELNFVFGEADVRARNAVIGLPRLRQEFYGFEPDPGLFLERAAKEAIHELGHLKCLGHCPDTRCVMQFSNSTRDTDLKEAKFCSQCRNKIKELI